MSKVLFLTNFYKSADKGLGLITKFKVEALRENGCDTVYISSPFKNSLARYIFSCFLDIKSVYYIITFKPDLFISRGSVGLLSLVLCRFMNIKTLREVHADQIEEARLIAGDSKFKRLGHEVIARFNHSLDNFANSRVYNNPILYKHFEKKQQKIREDFYCYNGYSLRNKSHMSKEAARNHFGLLKTRIYLVFVGAATEWHGIEYLIQLQREFNQNNDNIQIVCGGGSIERFDLDMLCLNIQGLNADGCANLIKAGDLCLLPVKSNRVSPGSPLKLYDYIVNERYVVTQTNTPGYSDEVDKLNIGISTDFSCSKEARHDIIRFLERSIIGYESKNIPVSWKHRLEFWLNSMGVERRK